MGIRSEYGPDHLLSDRFKETHGGWLVTPISGTNLLMLVRKERLPALLIMSLAFEGNALVEHVHYLRERLVYHLHEPGLGRRKRLVYLDGLSYPRKFCIKFLADAPECSRLAFGLICMIGIGHDARGRRIARIHFYEVMHERELRYLPSIELGSEPFRERAGDEPEHDGMIGIGLRRRAIRMARNAVGPAKRKSEPPKVSYCFESFRSQVT